MKQFWSIFWPISKPLFVVQFEVPRPPFLPRSLTDLEIAHYGVFTLTNFVTATVDFAQRPNRPTD